MPLFKLCATVTVSAYTEVEADTAEEALTIARQREADIGGNGTGIYADEYWVVEDIDGMPENIRIED